MLFFVGEVENSPLSALLPFLFFLLFSLSLSLSLPLLL